MTFRIPKHHLTDTRLVFFGQAGAGFISLVATIVTARYCGPTVFGFCVATILVLSVGLDLVDFGACSWSARELAAGRLSENDYFKVMRSKTRLNTYYLLTGPLILYFSSEAHWSLLFIGAYPALWVRTNYIQQFLMVKERFSMAVKLQILERFFWLLIIPLQFIKTDKWTAYIAPILMGLILHNHLGTKVISKFKEQLPTTNTSQRSLFQKTKHIGFGGIITDVSNLDTVIVARFASVDGAGSYGLVQRFRTPLLLGFNSFTTRLRPIAASGSKDSVRRLFKEEKGFITLNYLCLITASLLFLLFGDNLLGNKFQDINRILAIGVLVAIPASIIEISSALLVALANEHKVSRIYFISIPLTLFSVGVACYFQSVIGSVFALLIAKIISGVFFFFAALNCWKEL